MKKISLIAAFLLGTLFTGVGVFAASYVKANLVNFTINSNGKRISSAPALYFKGTKYINENAIDAALKAARVPYQQSSSNLSVKPHKANKQQSRSSKFSAPDQYGLSYGNVTISTSYGSTTIDGQVINHSNSNYSAVMITVSLFNKNGQLLGTADGAVQNLAPGQTQTFEAVSLNDLSNAATYECQTSDAG